MKKFFAEFKKFITRGNVLDMAVGVIVGGAFTGIVNGLTNNILKPLINWFIALIVGDHGLENAVTFLSKVEKTDPATGIVSVDLANSIYIDWGAFISAIINFFIIALVLFTIIKTINSVNEGVKKAKDYSPLTKAEVKQLYKQGKRHSEVLEIAQQRRAQLAEEKRIADEEAAKNAPKTEQQLLCEIVELLKERK